MTGFLVGTPVLAGLIATALLFDFLNGLHDSAKTGGRLAVPYPLHPRSDIEAAASNIRE